MDLSNFDTKRKSEEGAWVDILLPTEEDAGIRIKVLGRDSDRFQSRIKRVAEQDRQKKKGLSISELEKQSSEAYVICTIEWEGVEENDKVLECTSENVRHVYKQYPWVADQVKEFMEERNNFL